MARYGRPTAEELRCGVRTLKERPTRTLRARFVAFRLPYFPVSRICKVQVLSGEHDCAGGFSRERPTGCGVGRIDLRVTMDRWPGRRKLWRAVRVPTERVVVSLDKKPSTPPSTRCGRSHPMACRRQREVGMREVENGMRCGQDFSPVQCASAPQSPATR